MLRPTLTIVNNTPDTWLCKVGPDEQLLNLARVITRAIGAVSTIIATASAATAAGLCLPLITSGSVILVAGVATSSVLGVHAAVLGAIATTATVIKSMSTFSMYVANSIAEQLKKNSFQEIIPGKSHRMRVALWQQSQCVRRVILDERRVRVDTMVMRPTLKIKLRANRNYEIHQWIDANGVSSKIIEAYTDNTEQEY